MGQALLNLLTNALAALAEGGTIAVRVGREGDEALLEVVDDGPGMDAQTLARIWDLYYSTKEGGTGMGLPLVHRIVQEHGGGVTVQSAPGAGARFCIRLPMTRTKRPEEEL
jgi:signal transduction histidine kinase